MITNKDIIKIIEAQREVFVTKIDLENFKDEYKKGFSDLQTSVDAYAKKADTYFQEMTMLGSKVNRYEDQIQRIAGEIDMKLDY